MALASALSGIFGSALGFAGNVFGSNMSLKRQKELIDHQAAVNYAYGRLTAQNAPSWNRQGLEGAGYNPMLAVQNATSGVNSNFASQSNSTEPDYGSSLGAAINNAATVQNAKNQTAQTESNIQLNEAQSRSAIADAISKETHNKYLDDREQKELGIMDAQSTKLNHETDFIDAQIDNMEKMRELQQYLGERGQDLSYASSIYGADKAYNASTYSANKNYEGVKYGVDNNMLKAGIGATLGTLGLIYGPAKLKALRLLGKTKAVGF